MEKFLKLLIEKLNLKLPPGAESRTGDALSQVLVNFLFRMGSVACTFLLVPVTLDYLDKSSYGIWLTLSSMVAWLAFFDGGVGNGLKNKLAETFAGQQTEKAKSFISTCYFLLALFLSLFFLLYALVSSLIPWNEILNSQSIGKNELNFIALISIGFFCGRLLADLIGSVLAADQRTGEATGITFAGSVISLMTVFIISKTTAPSVLYVAIALSVIPAIVSILANIVLFATRYAAIRPSWKFVHLHNSKSLLKLSVNFFIIQIAVLIIYSTDNLIITQLFGPEDVTSYNIAYRYFGIITVVWGIMLTPYWTAFSSAYFGGDSLWIQKTTGRLLKVWIFIAVTVGLMLLIAPFAYKIWIGDTVVIPFFLSLAMSVFVLISTIGNLYVLLINASGKITLQLYASIAAALINIPMAYFFARTLGLGPVGVVMGNCVSLSSGPILSYIQYKKIVTGRDTGIWAR